MLEDYAPEAPGAFYAVVIDDPKLAECVKAFSQEARRRALGVLLAALVNAERLALGLSGAGAVAAPLSPPLPPEIYTVEGSRLGHPVLRAQRLLEALRRAAGLEASETPLALLLDENGEAVIAALRPRGETVYVAPVPESEEEEARELAEALREEAELAGLTAEPTVLRTRSLNMNI